jgi:trans-aconitate methyltransferase
MAKLLRQTRSLRRNSARLSRDGVIEQHWDPARYRRNASFVPRLGEPLLELLAPQPQERILDLGCGDGALTALLAARASVVGIDASAEQVAAARARGLAAEVADGARLDFAAEFDAVFSNAALHWMCDPDAVIAGVWRALKPGGRFVAECGGAGNVETVRRALAAALARHGVDAEAANPWYFPTPEEYRARLERPGFSVVSIVLIPRPTRLPGRLADWLDTFCESFLATVPPQSRPSLKAEVEEMLRDQLADAAGAWTVDYVRLRFGAVKPREEAS